MKLSEYRVKCPYIDYNDFLPFESFSNGSRDQRSPQWYRDYNSAKHDRGNSFNLATLRNLIQSIGGVYVLLQAQYGDFDQGPALALGIGNPIPRPFVINYKPTWTDEEKYQFDWNTLRVTSEPYENHPIPII